MITNNDEGDKSKKTTSSEEAPLQETTKKTSGVQKQEPYDPEMMEKLKREQIQRNNEWIEKMSPVVKYKIQEYIRKQKAKKMQRRKFSLACGLNRKPKPAPTRKRAKKNANGTETTTTTTTTAKKASTSSGQRNQRMQSQQQEGPSSSSSKASAPALLGAIRRKSAPVQKMDMRDLDDLE